MQPTSLQAYEEIKKSLGSKQAQVFKALELCIFSQTNSELAHTLRWPINTVTPRIFELRAKNLVKENHKRKCDITGHIAIAWRITRPEEITERQMEMSI